MLERKRIMRIIIEFCVYIILLSWMPISYQILFSIVLSLLIEIIFIRLENMKIRNQLSSGAIAKMTHNLKKYGKED